MDEGATRSYMVRTYGCQMNEHDSERIAGLLEADGLVRAESEDDADVVVLNTCCIRENADNKLYGNLGHLVPWKNAKEGRQIVVSGCLAQKDRELVARKAKHVDVVLGTHNVHRAAELIAEAQATDGPLVEILEEAVIDDHAMFPSALPARRETSYNAWVTIQIGCDNNCAFCIVPAVRGTEISRPYADIVDEVARLAAEGVTEVTLLGQNVNSYGRDLQLAARQAGDTEAKLRPLFADLLRDVGAVDGIRRVRYTSPHPKDMRPETFAAMAETSAVCEHLHYPLQSGSDRVLALMHRGYTGERYLDKLVEARRLVPELADLDRHHRRLPRRDRRRLRADARGGRCRRVRRRLHVHLLAAPRHRGGRHGGRLRRRGGGEGAFPATPHRHRAFGTREEPGSRGTDRGGPRRGPVEEASRRDDGPHPPEQARPLRAAPADPHRQLRGGRSHSRGTASPGGPVRRPARRADPQGAHPRRIAVTGRSVVLANSPVVGPLTLQPLAKSLAARGVAAVVAPAPSDLDAYISAVAAAAAHHVVLAGFSAAGPRLFAVAEAIDPAGIVFLDARLPDDGVAPSDETAFAELLDRLPLDGGGMLPPWSAWWPDGVIDALCPDREQRDAFVGDCPTVPRAMFDRPIPAPPFDGPCGFVAFADGYADQRELAEHRDWPTVRLEHHHLAPLVAPDDVAAALIETVERMGVW